MNDRDRKHTWAAQNSGGRHSTSITKHLEKKPLRVIMAGSKMDNPEEWQETFGKQHKAYLCGKLDR